MTSQASARLTVSLSGVSSDFLRETFNQLSCATSHQSSFCAGDKPNYPQRYVPCAYDQLRLGFVSADPSLGEWGRTVPVLFTPTSNDDTFAAVLPVAPALVARFKSDGFLPIRLVIIDEPLLLASAGEAIAPGASIVAVENLQSNPDALALSPDAAGDWFAHFRADGRTLRFTRAAEQFPFLSQFAPPHVSPDALRAAGPLLSLTLYANDPRVRFDREAWLAALPLRTRDAVMFLQREREAALTTAAEVEDIYPVPCDACCWCEGHLPVPAPMERQMNAVRLHTAEKKKKKKGHQNHHSNSNNNNNNNHNDNRNNKKGMDAKSHGEKWMYGSGLSTASVASDGSASSFSTVCRGPLNSGRVTTTPSYSMETVEDAFQRRGWCVQPLHHVDPIAPFSSGDLQLTMRVWHTMVNVAPLYYRGLQIEAVLPIPIYDVSQDELSEDSAITTGISSLTSEWCKGGKSFLCPANVDGRRSDRSRNNANNNNDNNNTDASRRENEARRDKSDSFSDAVIGVRWIRGVAVLQPPMFKQHTSSTLAVPMCFTDNFGIDGKSLSAPVTYWQTVYLQYLFVFPFENRQRGGNSLEVVRSLFSFNRLSTKKPVGHRGLGRTYTRASGDEEENNGEVFRNDTVTDAANDTSTSVCAASPKKRSRQIIKLAENTLESLNAAHRRGCEMVEFDVMLTRDRVPVIFHDPLIQLQAREKKWANAVLSFGAPLGVMGRSPSFVAHSLDTMCDLDALDNIRTHGVCTTGDESHCKLSSMRAYQFYMQNASNYSSIPFAMHQLTKRQLDLITTETFTHDKAENKLRNLILRHWHQILRVYRNRQRQMSIDALQMNQPDSDGEFSGCLPNDENPLLLQNAGNKNVESAYSSKSKHSADEYYKRFIRNPQGIRAKEEDVTNRICTLRDLFEETPPTLRFDLEVKFPFQPITDSNLFLQIDAFEINAFVDAILHDVFDYADQRQRVENADGTFSDLPRDVIFSSFEPDICIALKAKQSRFDVVFLCDTTNTDDIKDYRSFGLVEGSLQFSMLMNLSGISICAISLCKKDEAHYISTQNCFRTPKPFPESAALPSPGADGPLSPFAAQTQTTKDKDKDNDDDEESETEDKRRKKERQQRERNWEVFDTARGKNIVQFAHARAQRVWTWGAENNDENFTFAQSKHMNVDAIISDNVPLWSCASVETAAELTSRKTLST